MLLFVVGPFFQRRRRPLRPARDAMPMRPMLDLLIFWTVLMSGALAGALAVSIGVAATWFALSLERWWYAIAASAVAVSVISLATAMHFLWRLTRGASTPGHHRRSTTITTSDEEAVVPRSLAAS